MALLLTLAWRNLWRNYRRTLIMLVAIVLGVWAMIFMTALLRGMVAQMLESGIETLVDHVQVQDRQFSDDPSIEHRIEAPAGPLLERLGQADVRAWTTRVRVPAVVSSERESRGVTLVGVDPMAEAKLSFAAGSMIEGRWLERPDESGVVMGEELARQLQTRLGKRVVVMSQNPDNEIADRGVRVVGIYRATLQGVEQRYLFMGRETAQHLLGIEGSVSEIALQLQDPAGAEAVRDQLQALLPPAQLARSWQALDPYLATMLGVMDGFVLIWMLVVFLALSFGLVNTLVMALFERTRELGLMMALGLRPHRVLLQVLLEAILLLVLGLLLGNLLALASIRPLEAGIDISAVARGMEMMGAGSMLYPRLQLNDLVTANLVVVVLGVLASLLPAWRASRLRPLKALASH
ncbi:ABC transporter permease [Aestuariirhabdus litorea]|uniref:ABC transporter permease n=1 Tax=Aestuariirhabdus litorea TaxID=2528527 RepID=A0A3P3VK91_9GAMM|nr:ABC transporter permease [Aestuariirhabdus litorea]RRJ82794.1 ABC transporter permease [Aestuariirhabdus litorea]RWW92953.1 FtsX-like permease family protein [Endozoicomonadaceae bacterium GTF-13]